MGAEEQLARLKELMLAKLRPSLEERARTWGVVSMAVQEAERVAKELGVEVEVSVQGSIAKDTWISGDRDLDVFIRLPRSLGRQGVSGLGMEVARRTASSLGEFIESYAEHPYVQAFVEGYRLDLVPCFKLERLEEDVTAVDRTPFHTKFVNSRLTNQLRDEVRLLKGFMKGIGVYGAEVKVQGFSGYLCELLILHYGSFEEVLRGSLEWSPHEVFIDPAHHYASSEEALNAFSEPMVVIDPVDARRNVAAALSLQRMAEFVMASKLFLKKPSELFFYPPPPKEVGELVGVLRKRGTHLLAFKVAIRRTPPDVLWGQLYKSMDGLRTLLSGHGFEVLDSSAWSDEATTAIVTFELPALSLPSLEKRIGPPLQDDAYVDSFLKKHLGRDLKGPRLEGWRWVSYSMRRCVEAKELLSKLWRRARLGRLIQEGAGTSLEVLVNEEVEGLATRLKGYREHLAELLDGRPPWLRAYEEALRRT
ncbi:MAG: CCA tRNA nucleotidyltransferase [Candidatus Nezhaarchaeota archaeon]|nr:CCA tRNA nucleotidyltransferase [Candidatus Nezhaarchaeota archaeon]